MNFQEAINILKPQGNSEKELKSAYRTMSKKYHPDKAFGNEEMMKLVNAAFEFLKKYMGKWEVRASDFENMNTGSAIDECIADIFAKIAKCKGIDAEICGTWLWVSGNTKFYKNIFKQAGMKFSGKKKAWYWHPKGWKKKSRRTWDMDEIREQFGSQTLETEEAQPIG